MFFPPQASFMQYDLQFTNDQIAVALVLSAVGEILGKLGFSIFGGYLPCLKLYAVAVTSLLGAVFSGLMITLRTVPVVYAFSFGKYACRLTFRLYDSEKGRHSCATCSNKMSIVKSVSAPKSLYSCNFVMKKNIENVSQVKSTAQAEYP